MPSRIDLSHHAKGLGQALAEATDVVLTGHRNTDAALLYSAGVDSALLARICREMGHAPLLLCLGTLDSRDLKMAASSRSVIDLPIRLSTIDADDIAGALPPVQELLHETGVLTGFKKLDLIHLALGIGTYLACQIAHSSGIGLLLSAQGADALCAGFDRYQRVPREQLPATLAQDVQETIDTGLVRDRAVAALFSITFAAPFLDPRVIKVAAAIPTEFKIGPEGNKLVLRELARQKELPESIASRPKKSMQYSTGIMRILRQLYIDS